MRLDQKQTIPAPIVAVGAPDCVMDVKAPVTTYVPGVPDALDAVLDALPAVLDVAVAAQQHVRAIVMVAVTVVALDVPLAVTAVVVVVRTRVQEIVPAAVAVVVPEVVPVVVEVVAAADHVLERALVHAKHNAPLIVVICVLDAALVVPALVVLHAPAHALLVPPVHGNSRKDWFVK